VHTHTHTHPVTHTHTLQLHQGTLIVSLFCCSSEAVVFLSPFRRPLMLLQQGLARTVLVLDLVGLGFQRCGAGRCFGCEARSGSNRAKLVDAAVWADGGSGEPAGFLQPWNELFRRWRSGATSKSPGNPCNPCGVIWGSQGSTLTLSLSLSLSLSCALTFSRSTKIRGNKIAKNVLEKKGNCQCPCWWSYLFMKVVSTFRVSSSHLDRSPRNL